MLNDYEKQLRQTNLADNTIVSYCHSLKQYLKMYENVFTKKNLLSFKGFLIENYSPKTVNLRILAINKYLEFNKLDKLKLKMIKVQQKTYLENVISDADYKFFKNKLKKDGRLNWYFIVRYLTLFREYLHRANKQLSQNNSLEPFLFPNHRRLFRL